MFEKIVKATLALIFVIGVASAASAQTPDRKCTTSEPDAVGKITTTCTDVKPFDPLGDLKKRAQAEADRKQRIQEQADAKAVADAQIRAANAQVEAAHALTASSTPAPVATTLSAGERMWTSIKTGNDLKIRLDGEYIYTQIANLSPALQSTPAFVRSEFKKVGEKWVGKTYFYLPYQGKKSTKWCRFETDIEIDEVSDSRIAGMAPHWSSFNVQTCQPEGVEMQSFTWIPK